ATLCICVGVLNGALSLSKQWLALKNHGFCVELSLSFSSVPVHKPIDDPSTNTICATDSITSRKALVASSGEHWTSTLHDPASPMSARRLSARRSAGSRKRWPTSTTRGSAAPGLRARGEKNSTV